MLLPIFQDESRNLMMLQTRWASLIQPILNQPISSGSILTNIDLVIGDNIINHLLGRKMQGWIITDQDAVSDIYRSAELNSVTLTLNSSAAVTVSIFVF